jgi:hypothetical protein
MYNIELNKEYVAAKVLKWSDIQYYTLTVLDEKYDRYRIKLVSDSEEGESKTTHRTWVHKAQVVPNMPGLKINTEIESISFGTEPPSRIKTGAPTMYVLFMDPPKIDVKETLPEQPQPEVLQSNGEEEDQEIEA